MKKGMKTAEDIEELRSLLHTFMAGALGYEAEETLRLLKREDLTMPLITAMKVVERKGVCSISAIGSYLSCTLGNSSMVVDKLVHNGWATRVEDIHDRRHKQVQLTEKGQALLDELRATKIEAIVQRVMGLSAEQRTRLLDVLRDIVPQFTSTDVAVTTEHA